MKRLIYLIVFLFSVSSVLAQKKFSFAYFTDLHLNKDEANQSFKGLEQAIGVAKKSKVDFVLTGGDNVDVDAMKAENLELAKSLFQRYKDIVTNSGLKWFYTIGNHDRYWFSEGEHGSGLFSSYFGKTYYSFEHKGWKFITLNSTEICNGKYCISDVQKNWLISELEKTPAGQPIIVSTHVPFLSLYYPVLEGYYTDADTFINQKDVRSLFDKHNLKLVLQGHQHLYEEIKVKGVQYITAGAICAGWWGGSFHGTEEGYLQVNIDGDDFGWDYIDYGWEVAKK